MRICPYKRQADNSLWLRRPKVFMISVHLYVFDVRLDAWIRKNVMNLY